MADADQQDRLCRICFSEAEPERGVQGRLVTPCKCIGSVRHVHLGCLRTWQVTQRTQGRERKAVRCELCGSKYRIPQRILKAEGVNNSTAAVQTISRWLMEFHKAEQPVWQKLMRCWQAVHILVGLFQAGSYGLVGLAAGSHLGILVALKCACCLARLAPGLVIAANIRPDLQQPLAKLGVDAGLGMAVATPCMALVGAFCGAVYGFCQGSLGFGRWATNMHLEAMFVAAKCAGLTVKAAGQVTVVLGARLFAVTNKACLLSAALYCMSKFIG